MIYTLFIVIGGFIMLYSAFYLGSDWNELSKKERTNYLLKLGFGTILCLGSFIYNESLYQYKCEEKDGDIKKAYVNVSIIHILDIGISNDKLTK